METVSKLTEDNSSIITNVDTTSEINEKPKDNKIKKIRNHKCKTCLKSFPTRHKLECHKQTHKQVITCQYCNALFPGSSAKFQLKYHIFTKHLSDFPYKCPDCNKGYNSQESVKRHFTLSHTGKFPYVCNICNRSCKQKSAYDVHMLIHNKERPHICNECNAKFKGKSGLSAHWQYTHSNKKYNCSNCDKSFKTNAMLKKHSIRIHNIEGTVEFSTQDLTIQIRQKDNNNKSRPSVNNSIIIEIPKSQEMDQQNLPELQPQLIPADSPVKGRQESLVTSQQEPQPSPPADILQGQQKSEKSSLQQVKYEMLIYLL